MPTRKVTSDPTPEANSRALPHLFFFGPFRFASEIDIPELRNSRGSGQLPVTIRLGNVPAAIEGAASYGAACHLTATEYLLEIPGTARYYVRNGNQVRLDIEPGAPIANVSTYLLGSVFGALCHQNGLLPLHASAVEHHGNVIAFLGESGAGKSTLAACLQRRGHRIVSDDICLLESHANSMRVIPVAGWLKLWDQSLQHLGETPDEQHRVFSTDDKFRVFLTASESAGLPLARVLFLTRSDSDDPHTQPSLQLLPPPEAIAGLMDMTYAAYVPALSGQDPRVFQQCVRIFQHAQAFRLTMPWGFNRIDAVLDLLEAEIFRPLRN